MENRLCLNKKIRYELPDNVRVGFYNKYNKKPSLIPDFEPDLCLNTWGSDMSVSEIKSSSRQIWIKTDDKKLLDFISNNNWNNYLQYTTYRYINMWQFKKIILEEFYGVKNGE